MLDFFLLFLVDPLCLYAAPLGNLCLGEPQSDLLLSRLYAVAAVYDVPAHVHAEIPANRSRRRILQGAKITPVIRRREDGAAGNNERNFPMLRIHDILTWIRILLFSSLTFKMPAKK